MSQVEQRLNAFSPNASPENQRINSFSGVDRESFSLSLHSQLGSKISKSLAFRDLFSFDVMPNQVLRSSLEEMFQQYEGTIKTNTVELLQKLEQGEGDIKREILELFAAKLMNFLRNPYSAKKVLNTVGGVLRFHPADPQLLANYEAVLAGAKRHQRFLCDRLGINLEEYQPSLTALFMTLFRPLQNEPNMMEGIIKGVFELPSGYPIACVYRYNGKNADKRCLLSDRGYSTPLRQDQHLSFSFNLSSNAFITYLFASVNAVELTKYPPALIGVV